MKYAFIGAAAFLMFAPSMAQAADLNDSSYVSAARCVAYAELPQLSGDGLNVVSLSSAIEAYTAQPAIRERARGVARDARLAGRRAGENERAVGTLRNRRDDACADFVSTGIVQAAAVNPAS